MDNILKNTFIQKMLHLQRHFQTRYNIKQKQIVWNVCMKCEHASSYVLQQIMFNHYSYR